MAKRKVDSPVGIVLGLFGMLVVCSFVCVVLLVLLGGFFGETYDGMFVSIFLTGFIVSLLSSYLTIYMLEMYNVVPSVRVRKLLFEEMVRDVKKGKRV